MYLHNRRKCELFDDANSDSNQYIDGKVLKLQELWEEKIVVLLCLTKLIQLWKVLITVHQLMKTLIITTML